MASVQRSGLEQPVGSCSHARLAGSPACAGHFQHLSVQPQQVRLLDALELSVRLAVALVHIISNVFLVGKACAHLATVMYCNIMHTSLAITLVLQLYSRGFSNSAHLSELLPELAQVCYLELLLM